MTIETKKSQNPRKDKQPIDEKIQLLPKKRILDDEHGVHEFNGASFTGSVFNLSTTIIGAGIMALPATMKVLGLGLGIVMIVVVAILTEAAVEFLLRFSRAGKSASYGELMRESFGKFGRVAFQICILVNNIGILTVYMIIIGKQQFKQLFVIFLRFGNSIVIVRNQKTD